MRTVLYFLICCPVWLGAQVAPTPVAHYLFDGNLGDATGSSANLGVAEGVVDFDCGVSGDALYLASDADQMRIPGGATTNVNRLFGAEDFTVAFYFKPTDTLDRRRYLLAKQDPACNANRYFTVSYSPENRRVRVSLRRDAVSVVLRGAVDTTACWQQVTVRRWDNELRLYINGRSVASETSPGRIDAANEGDLIVGGAACPGSEERGFSGLIDDLRFYGSALSNDQVADLYGYPDHIIQDAARVFLGEKFDITLRSNCGTRFSWTPTDGISDPNIAEPTLSPAFAGNVTYYVRIADDQSPCVATDSISIRGVDPDNLDCNKLYFPKAFTPNGIGPEANETFGISNPYAARDLVAFEIFDRYGGRVFTTGDAFARWDGNFKGQPVNGGVMLWRVIYLCEGVELSRTGSVTILR